MFILFDDIYNYIIICPGTTHSVRAEEQLAFSDWINTNLGGDQHLDHILPLHHTGAGLYDAVKDGASIIL